MGVAKDWWRAVCVLPLGLVSGQALGDPGDGRGACGRVFALPRIGRGVPWLVDAVHQG
jgi:hypothetical protein